MQMSQSQEFTGPAMAFHNLITLLAVRGAWLQSQRKQKMTLILLRQWIATWVDQHHLYTSYCSNLETHPLWSILYLFDKCWKKCCSLEIGSCFWVLVRGGKSLLYFPNQLKGLTFFFLEVKLVYNIMLVSELQHNNPGLYTLQSDQHVSLVWAITIERPPHHLHPTTFLW